MALPDIDGSVGHSFGLEVDGVFTSRLSEVSGLRMERDVVETKETGPDGAIIARKLPGRWKSPEVTLVRGLTADASFAKWVREAQPGASGDTTRSGAITVFDVAGARVTKYVFTKAWPRSLEIVGTVGADGTPILSERLVLVCEHLEPE